MTITGAEREQLQQLADRDHPVSIAIRWNGTYELDETHSWAVDQVRDWRAQHDAQTCTDVRCRRTRAGVA